MSSKEITPHKTQRKDASSAPASGILAPLPVAIITSTSCATRNHSQTENPLVQSGKPDRNDLEQRPSLPKLDLAPQTDERHKFLDGQCMHTQSVSTMKLKKRFACAVLPQKAPLQTLEVQHQTNEDQKGGEKPPREATTHDNPQLETSTIGSFTHHR